MQTIELTNWVPHLRRNNLDLNAAESVRSLAWPASQMDEALSQLAQRSGLRAKVEEIELVSLTTEGQAGVELAEWLNVASAQLGIEVEPVGSTYGEINHLLRYAGPALLPLMEVSGEAHAEGMASSEMHFLALLKGGRGRLTILGVDGETYRLKPDVVRAALCQALEAPLLPEINQVLETMALPQWRRNKACAVMLREQLGHLDIAEGWLLRPLPGTGLWQQLKQARLIKYLWSQILFRVIGQATLLGAIWLIERSASQGEISWATMTAGLLILLSGVPFTVLGGWLGFIFDFGAAHRLKRRLFYGVLHLNLADLQRQGIGQFLAWVTESETLEEVAFTQSVFLYLSLIPTLVIIAALFITGDILIGSLMLAWLLLTFVLGYRLCRRYISLNEQYTTLITTLLERIRGHQTRLVQEREWHTEDDRTLADYLTLSQQYDRRFTRLWVLAPYGWIIIMLAAVGLDFVANPGNGAGTTFALRFAALLLGATQFQFLALTIPEVAKAIAAWMLIKPIQRAAVERATQIRTSAAEPEAIDVEKGASLLDTIPLLEGQGLKFRYQAGARLILDGCNLEIYRGDRLLLEGPSGGGKSTLAALLIDLYRPESGLLLLNGLDRHIISTEVWRQRIVAAPQFHENHVLNASLAFNLLMGRQWPATPDDLAEAEIICRELGLGPLIDRMPLGLHQLVGDQGWHLSHGERSRLFIARALLQKADIIILDESFGSLDPENMQKALECVLNRASTLLVIAHP